MLTDHRFEQHIADVLKTHPVAIVNGAPVYKSSVVDFYNFNDRLDAAEMIDYIVDRGIFYDVLMDGDHVSCLYVRAFIGDQTRFPDEFAEFRQNLIAKVKKSPFADIPIVFVNNMEC